MRNNWSGRTFPHPEGRKPVLNDFRFGMRSRPVMTAVDHAATLGPNFELLVFDQKIVFIHEPELVAELCDEKKFEKAVHPSIEGLRHFAGDGLFTAYTEEPNWGIAHDLLMPAFTRQAMTRYHDTMQQVCDEMLAVWARSSGPIDAPTHLTKVTLETIGRTSFSHDFGSFTRDEIDPFIPAMVRGLRVGNRRGAVQTAPKPLAKALIAGYDRFVRNSKQYVEDMIDDIVRERLRAGEERTDDLLGLMLHTAHEKTGTKLDPINIRNQVLTFLVAGHETTSGALSFALYYLTKHPDVLARCRQETVDILGDDLAARPQFEQVAKFRYLRRVLDEALRLWPTAPAFARQPRGREVMLGGRYRMTPKDFALVLLPVLHRDPSLWGPDAEKFDPDNFLPERIKARPGFAYKPFGTGERACIGRQFALHEAILVLANIIHRFDIAGDPAYDLKITERLTLMPDGFTLTARERVQSAAAA